MEVGDADQRSSPPSNLTTNAPATTQPPLRGGPSGAARARVHVPSLDSPLALSLASTTGGFRSKLPIEVRTPSLRRERVTRQGRQAASSRACAPEGNISIANGDDEQWGLLDRIPKRSRVVAKASISCEDGNQLGRFAE